MQALVDGWTDAGEGMRRLIYEAPPLLCVQISRFHGRRKIRKLMHQVMLGNGRVHIPCRERPGVDASELCYRVTAISVHLGNTPSSGHYRAVLMAQGSSECALGTGDFAHIILSTTALCILMMAVLLYQFCKGMCMPSRATCISCGASEWSEASCNLSVNP